MKKNELTEEEKHELLTNRFTAPFKARVIGHEEVTEEEKQRVQEFYKREEERKRKNK